MTEQTSDEVRGVAFPDTGDGRHTTPTGRGVFADAARALDTGLADTIEAEPNWRHGYLVHARRLLEARLRDRHRTVAVAEAGLASLHSRFEFVTDEGATSLRAALDAGPGIDEMQTAELRGSATEAETTLSVPYKGGRLSGDDLHRRLDDWVDAGTVEPSFADAIRLVMENPDWIDLSDLHVAVLGAGAEMGPLFSLCRWGAHVLPVDLPRPDVQARIIATVRQGRGRATLPLHRRPDGDDDASLAAAAGLDLVVDTPTVAAWLANATGPLTLGNYAYADGSMHVRVSMAADAIAACLTDRRDDVSLAVLATPTDVFAVPAEVVETARRRFVEPGWQRSVGGVARTFTAGRVFAPNYPDTITTEEGATYGVADCLVAQQGPNYALAKRLQRWRATVERERGRLVSVNVAPPTRTRSVLRNRALAAAYGSARRFGIEVFDPSTSNTLMAALLVHDLRNPGSSANPAASLEHPLDLFVDGANHGGLWRNPFAPRSVLGLAVVLGMVQRSA